MSVSSNQSYLEAIGQALTQFDQSELSAIVDVLYGAFLEGRNVFTFGNGASAALASHMACDLGKGTATDIGGGPGRSGVRRLRVNSLVDNTALVTALSNDVAYEDVFVEQLKNLLSAGDVAIGVSGSGSSPNVLHALDYARRNGAITIGFTGARASALAMQELCDACLQAPLTMMEQIEDLHVICHHMITLRLRQRIADWAAARVDPSQFLTLVGE
jgi:D-sedoheptulose 7-phosphate isomerase